MIRRLLYVTIALLPLIGACRPSSNAAIAHAMPLGRSARIEPDYAGVTFPPNIAPPNFKLQEQCRSCVAEFSSKNGGPLQVSAIGASIRIPPAKWRKLLEANRGEPLHVRIYFEDASGRWLAANTMEDTIAGAPIDRFVTYRVLSFLYNYSTDISIHERDLESFHERTLLNSANYSWGCCNCHMPLNNDPSSFALQARSSRYGSSMVLSLNGKITPIASRLGYTAWHPGGRYIAFSVYKVEQCFHAATRNPIDVYDKSAAIVIYNVAKKTLDSVPLLADRKFLQTWPAWSPDGRYLYYCSAPVLWSDLTKSPPDDYDKVKYSLCRVAFDETGHSWGAVDTILTPRETGLSISQPRISPNGRFLLFCMHERGAYPHTQKSSDLYLMDLGTRKYQRLDVSSEYSESWHGWSSNSRWILFSTKRGSGIFTRLYFSYVDSNGCAHKPFIMPQEDPAFYDSFIKCYNVPEFAKGPVKFDQRDLLRAIRSKSKVKVPVPSLTPVPSNPHIQ